MLQSFSHRYERHVRLPEIGEAGQKRLSSASAVVVGAGGLGSPVLYYLASAGVGHIKIIDSDTVDMTNLNRQFLYNENDIGKEKSRTAAENLKLYNSDIQISAVTAALDDDNARQLLDGADIVLSCVDNKITRYVLNKASLSSGVPMIDGGVQGFEGYILTILPGITPCYQCIFPKYDQTRDVGGAGVVGAAAGVPGSMMAMEAIKVIVGMPISSYFHHIDMLNYRITPIIARRAADCPACGG